MNNKPHLQDSALCLGSTDAQGVWALHYDFNSLSPHERRQLARRLPNTRSSLWCGKSTGEFCRLMLEVVRHWVDLADNQVLETMESGHGALLGAIHRFTKNTGLPAVQKLVIEPLSGSVVGKYRFGRGEIVLSPECSDSNDIRLEVINTVYHELVHLQGDVLVIRSLIDAVAGSSAVSGECQNEIINMYQHMLGTELCSRFLHNIMMARAGQLLSQEELLYAAQLTEERQIARPSNDRTEHLNGLAKTCANVRQSLAGDRSHIRHILRRLHYNYSEAKQINEVLYGAARPPFGVTTSIKEALSANPQAASIERLADEMKTLAGERLEQVNSKWKELALSYLQSNELEARFLGFCVETKAAAHLVKRKLGT